MKKIKAYSILELVAVMIISTVTIAITYQGYLLFHKQFIAFNDNCDKNSTLTQLNVLLYIDFKDSREVRRTDDGILCKLKSKEISYHWSEEYIIRKQHMVADTFYLEIDKLVFKRNSEEAAINELVSELSFTGNENLHFLFSKDYSTDLLMNSEKKEL